MSKGLRQIYLVSLHGPPRLFVKAPAEGMTWRASWSPDGRTIAFERDIEPIADGILQVFVMNADGTDPTPLTGLPSENDHPGWGRGHLVGP